MKKNLGNKLLNAGLTVGLGVSILACGTLVNLTYKYVFEDYKKPGYEQEQIASQYISLTNYISGYNRSGKFQELSEFAGCNFDDIEINAIIQQRLAYYEENTPNKSIIDCDYLIKVLKEKNTKYLLINGQYYTENGEDLLEVTIEKEIGETTEKTLDNGITVQSADFLVPRDAISRGNKLYIRATILIPVNEEMELPKNYILVKIGDTIETKPYSNLKNREIHSEYTDEEVYTLNLK